MPDRECLILFLRFPEKGTVKSRLAKECDENSALILYKHFVSDLLNTLNVGPYHLKLYFSPRDALHKISAWLGKGYSYAPQRGEDLGDRMKNAFLETFSDGFTKVLLIGSDVPDLTRAIIIEAYAIDDCDAVIGPTLDGGYYLIGFKHNTFSPRVFEGIQWSTDRVYSETMKLFAQMKYRVHILPEKRDIDRLEDLRAFFERNRNTVFANSETMVFIRNNFRILFGDTYNY